jgi:hypothetical protein
MEAHFALLDIESLLVGADFLSHCTQSQLNSSLFQISDSHLISILVELTKLTSDPIPMRAIAVLSSGDDWFSVALVRAGFLQTISPLFLSREILTALSNISATSAVVRDAVLGHFPLLRLAEGFRHCEGVFREELSRLLMNIARYRLSTANTELLVRIFGRLLKWGGCDRLSILWGVYFVVKWADALEKVPVGLLRGLMANATTLEALPLCLIVGEIGRLGYSRRISGCASELAIALLGKGDDEAVKAGLVFLEAAVTGDPEFTFDVSALERVLDSSGFFVRLQIARIVLDLVDGGVSKWVGVPAFYSVVKKLADGGEGDEQVWEILRAVASDPQAVIGLRDFGIDVWVAEQMSEDAASERIESLRLEVARAVFSELRDC